MHPNFTRPALQVIADHLPAEEVEALKQEFEKLDKDGDGTITLEELRQQLTSNLPPEQLQVGFWLPDQGLHLLPCLFWFDWLLSALSAV